MAEYNNRDRPNSSVILDMCYMGGGLARNPIPEVENLTLYTKLMYGEELTLDHLIQDGDLSFTLGKFCEMCDTIPFKIVVVRDEGYARVRDDQEWLISRDVDTDTVKIDKYPSRTFSHSPSSTMAHT